MKKSKWTKKGFSVIELIVVMTIIGGLYVLGSNTLFAPQRSTVFATTIDNFLAEVSNQQNKAMAGDIGSGTTNDNYGVYLTPTSYTTFRGASYAAGNSTNFTTNLNGNLRFSTINLPGSQIVYATSSGEIVGYSGAQNSVVLQDSVGSLSKTIRFNQYGVVESVQ